MNQTKWEMCVCLELQISNHVVIWYNSQKKLIGKPIKWILLYLPVLLKLFLTKKTVGYLQWIMKIDKNLKKILGPSTAPKGLLEGKIVVYNQMCYKD